MQKTNLNVTPYYDDFDKKKNYTRILFKPTAVQARELTQLQTILQNQIEQFGSHIFVEGSVVSGVNPILDSKYNYVRLFDSSNNSIVDVTKFANVTIQGATGGVKARVVTSHLGAQANTPNMKTLYFKYISSGTDGVTKSFVPGERLFATSNTQLVCNVFTTADSVGNSSVVFVANGVIFARGTFLQVNSDKVVVSKYNNTPSVRVGFEVQESIVTAETDSTLNDPASGSYNYTAPGASRLKLNPILTTKTLSAANTDTFFELFQIANGIVQTAAIGRPQYNAILDEIARRTYDESGNYTVKPFGVRIQEHLKSANNGGLYTAGEGGDKNKLIVVVEPGKAYVNGYEYENVRPKYIPIDKATDYVDLDEQNITANYGNYTLVYKAVGEWDINNLTTVNLHSVVANATSRLYTSNTASLGSVIGTARVKSVVYDSGNFNPDGTAKYRLYLFDIKITTATKNFGDVRAFSYTSGNKRGLADAVLSSGKAVIYDTNFDGSIFPLPANTIRRLRDANGNVDTTIVYKKSVPVTIGTNGTFTLNLSGETFNEGTGTLNSTQKRENFYVALAANGLVNATGTVTIATSNTITGSSTLFDREFRAGDLIVYGTNNYVRRIVSIASNTSMTITPSGGITRAGLTFQKVFPKGHVVDLSYTAHNSSYKNRSVTLSTTTSASFNLQETFTGTVAANVNYIAAKTSARETGKIVRKGRYVRINLNTHTAGTTGPWQLGVPDVFKIEAVRLFTSAPSSVSGGTDVTEHFDLDSGQRDDAYEIATFKKKLGSSLSLSASNWLLVKFSYFVPDYSQGFGYYSVDSYPVDDVNVANTTAITTATIPTFTSPTTNRFYELRNVIDIRPSYTATANDVTSLTNISTNPANNATIAISTSARVLVPNENIVADVSYYMPRIDKLFLNSKGMFVISKGTPALRPVSPDDVPNAMQIATISIPPYPSISPTVAKQIGNDTYMVTNRIIDNQRYTMRDIGSIKARVTNLEYYTTLSMLELDVLNKQFLNNSGVDRFKNGIFVDGFAGHDKTDTSSLDFKAAIDKTNKIMRPTFDIVETTLDYSTDSTNVQRRPRDIRLTITPNQGSFANGETITSSAGGVSGKLMYRSGSSRLYIENAVGTFAVGQAVTGGTSSANGLITSISEVPNSKLFTLPYTHSEIITQPFATKTRNASGEFYFFFKGILSLDPESDTWYDTTYAPDITTTNTDDKDNILSQIRNGSIQLGTTYGDWQTYVGINQEYFEDTRHNETFTYEAIGSNGLQQRNDIVQVTRSVVLGRLTTSRSTTRQVTTTSLGFDETTKMVDDKLLGTTVIPYMRSININFKVAGLAPTTKHYAFFDDVNVSGYCRPANAAGANTGGEGAALVSDSQGSLYGMFRVPNSDALRFRTGEHVFKVSDGANTSTSGTVFSSAETLFSASGSLQSRQRSYLTTRVPKVVTSTTNEGSTDTSVSEGWAGSVVSSEVIGQGAYYDPIAQSFMASTSNVPSPNYFISRLDLYFKTKSATMPVSVEIREMENGMPTRKIIPNGIATLFPDDVNVSNDSSIPTPFYFDGLPCLTTGTEYCFVVKPGGNSPDYEVWVSELGGKDKLTSKVITEQPYLGLLFSSSNDYSWTPQQGEDIKFKLHAAQFNTGVSGQLVLKNETANYYNVANVNNDFTGSEPVQGEVRVMLAAVSNTGSGTGATGQAVLGMTSRATGTVTLISGTNGAGKTIYRIRDNGLNNKFVSGEVLRFANGAIGNVVSTSTPVGTLKYYRSTFANSQIHLSNTATKVVNASGTFVTSTLTGANNTMQVSEQMIGQLSGSKAFVSTIDNPLLNTLFLNISTLKLANTSLDFGAKTSTALALGSVFDTVLNKNNSDFILEEKRLFSKQNEISTLSGSKSLHIKATFTSNDPFVSPVVDTQRASAYVISNVINDLSTNETNSTGGSAKAKYISRIVTLADGQDAEDLKVLITAFKPPYATVKVYVKILNKEDSTIFSNRNWTELTQSTNTSVYSDEQSPNDLIEYEYDFPTSSKTGTNGEVQYTNTGGATFTGFKQFAIKVVLNSTVTYNPPFLKDLRAIALQI